jgi:histidinol-phosphate aminotransferase
MIESRKGLLGVVPYPVPSYSRKDKLRFDLNESNFGCSPKVMRALKSASKSDLLIYPEYEKLNNKLAEEYNVLPSNILLTNGGDDAIRSVTDTFVDKKDEVLLPVPTYSMFELYAKLSGAKIKEVVYNRDFSFPINKVLKGISQRTKMVVVVNPASPLGSTVTRQELIEILDKAKNSIVLLDETYHHFSGKSMAHLIKEYDNLVVIQSFSKVYGLAGLRLGCIITNHEALKEISKVAFPYAATSLAVSAAYAAMSDEDYTEKVILQIENEKKFLCSELKSIAEKVHNTDTNFIIAKFGKSSDELHEKLEDKGLLVRNIGHLPLMKGYLRISPGVRKENVELVKAINNLMPPEAILFDMDGVLIDVDMSYRMAIKKTAEFFVKEEITSEEIQKYKDKGGYNDDWDLTEAIIISRKKKITKIGIINMFQQFYLGRAWDGLIQNEQLLLDTDILDKLSNDFKLGIVSGRPKKELEYTLKRFKISKYFDTTICMEDTKGKGKPDPFGITLALKKLKVSRVFYVGDTVDDVIAAKAAGITPIAVLQDNSANYKKKKEKFISLGSKQIIQSVNEVYGILR